MEVSVGEMVNAWRMHCTAPETSPLSNRRSTSLETASTVRPHTFAMAFSFDRVIYQGGVCVPEARARIQ